jgi:hypothetical protein
MLIEQYAMRMCEGVNVKIKVFLTSALVGGEWSALGTERFSFGKTSPGTHWIGRWVGFRTGLDDVERRKNFALTGTRPLGRPSCGQSLY